jgi:hypothetical protein
MYGRSGSAGTCIINLVVCGERLASRPGKEPKLSNGQGKLFKHYEFISFLSACVRNSAELRHSSIKI